MNYGELKARVMESIGAVTGELDDEIEGFCQDAMDDLHSEDRWPWNRKSTSLRIYGYLTGTCSFTTGTTSITLDTGGLSAATFQTQYDGGLIEIAGGSIYEISDYDQATQVVTVKSTIVEATAASGASTYQLIQDTVTLPSDVESVIEITDPLNDIVLRGWAQHERRRLMPNPFDRIGSDPTYYWARGVDASGNIQIGVYPPPTTDTTYTLEYWSRLSYPSTDNDELEAALGLPQRFHPVLLARARAKAYEFEDENESKRARADAEYLIGVDKMKRLCRPTAHARRQFHSDRSGPGYRWWDPDRFVDIDASGWNGGLGF